MGLPEGNLGKPIFQPTPTQGGFEYGGNLPTPKASQAQPVPFPTGQAQTPQSPGILPIAPESLPNFTQQESDALKNRFFQYQFGKGNPFGGGIL